jgi:diguanylate cyclase (GGDEF)-like protein
MPTSNLLRTDPLTGCLNLLAFIEWIGQHFTGDNHSPITVLSLDVNRFQDVNLERGRDEGDAVLRWVGIVLHETGLAPVYRTGGDEFAAICQGNPLETTDLAQKIFEHLNREAAQIGLENPPASLSVVHFDASSSMPPEDALLIVGAAILQNKKLYQRGFHVFDAAALGSEMDHHLLHWFAGRMIENIVLLGRKLDETEHMAFTDPLTGLPNQRAAATELEAALGLAAVQSQSLALILIDGDNLKAYNEFSYANGDEMICLLGETLRRNLRPDDFLARWRVGDEFLVILHHANREQARQMGQRLVEAVRSASQNWLLPTSISAGIAISPEDGTTPSTLLAAVERANMQAKAQGKDQVV